MLHHSFHGAETFWRSLVSTSRNAEWIIHITNKRECQCHSWCPRICPAYYWSPCNGCYGIYARKATEPTWLEEVCIFIVSTSTDDMLICLWAPRILVCDMPEEYEKLIIDFLSLLSCFKVQLTMLFVIRHSGSLPSEGWICNFEIVRLFRRSRVYWTRHCAIWLMWVSEQTRLRVSTHLNVSYESEMQSLLARHLRNWPWRHISQKTFVLVSRYMGQLWTPLDNLS